MDWSKFWEYLGLAKISAGVDGIDQIFYRNGHDWSKFLQEYVGLVKFLREWTGLV